MLGDDVWMVSTGGKPVYVQRDGEAIALELPADSWNETEKKMSLEPKKEDKPKS